MSGLRQSRTRFSLSLDSDFSFKNPGLELTTIEETSLIAGTKSFGKVVPCFHQRGFYLVFFLFLLIGIEAMASDFQFHVTPEISRKFRHWNESKKEVTGYTTVSYIREKNTDCLIELSKNLGKDRKVFSEKKLWFSPDLSRLIRYEESDLRTDMRTINTYSTDIIHTEAWQKDEKLEFDIQVRHDLVPFEILPHFLQSQIHSLKKDTILKFSLYLPAIATELKNKGMPLSWSKLEMKASIVAMEKLETILGQKETITLQLEATSFLINALLPKDKSRFRFTFMKEAPHHLLVFEEGETKTILDELN